jgi:prolyl-tRNA synthetase
MRGREFTMKDAYSFDRDREAARQLPGHVRRLLRIFDRMGLTYRAVAADTGAIGGDAEHEFQVIADTGEDAIVYCPGSSDYAANIELAEAWRLLGGAPCPPQPMAKDAHAGQEHLRRRGRAAGPAAAAHREVAGAGHRRAATRRASGDRRHQVWLLLVRGDHELNEVKAGKLPG